jgi:chemosensory pili system protein ChpA (sensor histidine kinase/response regulator)
LDANPATTQEPKLMTRVSSKLIDNLLRMTGEGRILRAQFKEKINHFSATLKTLNQLTWSMQSRISELEQSVNLHNHSSYNPLIQTQFDPLEMEQYNEVHTATGRLTEVATDIRNLNVNMDEQLINLKYLMMDEEIIQKENQTIIQSIRMIPVSSIASRCQRVVRQACRMANKTIELNIQGDKVLMDSEILNSMIEPLMNLLRNAVDHGIESSIIRRENNKSEQGHISLDFTHQGHYVLIRCQDDGAGLSNKAILQSALTKGLITAEQKLTEAEIHQLILLPGFSTRTHATQLSGRGMGMDVVQTKISELQGQMSLYSVENKGLSIEIFIPQTLSSMLSLLVRCGERIMAISNRGLQKVYHADEYELIENKIQTLNAKINQQHYPTRYFNELLGQTIAFDKTQKLPALQIIDEMGQTYLIFVDELLGYKDLLVKNMGHYLAHIQGITGASILSTGAVAPVIDLVEMLHNGTQYDFLLADTTQKIRDKIGHLPIALVIDDSLSARHTVVILLEDYGLKVETAIDGLDAIKHIEAHQPDIIVVDLEMPRMNGIELTAHIRGDEQTKAIPIIMITSRVTEKHRKQAQVAGVSQFMTKPFSAEDLIDYISQFLSI